MNKALIPIALLFLSGCVSTPNGKVLDPQLMAAIAQEATRVGSATVLAVHPEYRPQFEQAKEAVTALLAVGTADIGQLTAILGRLPIAEGPQGQIGIIIGQGFITLWGLYGEQVLALDKSASFTKFVQPVAQGILAGFDRALAEMKAGVFDLTPRAIRR